MKRPENTENLWGDYSKSILHVIIGLKTVKSTKRLNLGPSIYELILKERAILEDVIYMQANTGAVKRVGRLEAFATELDLEEEEYVPLPKGDVDKKKEVIQHVTLHDLDAGNAKPHV